MTYNRRLLLFFAAGVAASAFPAASNAYNPMTVGSCTSVSWPSNPRVILHTSEMRGFSYDMELALLDAMEAIHAQIDAVGASSAGITGFYLSSDPFTFRSEYSDPVPTIHVGFTSNTDAADGAAKVFKSSRRCEITSANIRFLNPSSSDPALVDWLFGEPGDEGEDYWLADHNLNRSAYFRISYMHEMLHAWGLKHSPDSYSMLNYGTRPFANRGAGKQVRPLPDDMEFLRDTYPEDRSTRALAVLNTWFSRIDDPNGAAPQRGLCAPSTGSGWDDWSAPRCATDASTLVCPGDWVYTQSAVANYGTEDLDIEQRLWFSLDEHWTRSDLVSPTIRSYRVSGNASSKQGRVFIVPDDVIPGQTYQPITRVVGMATDGATKRDWIPLRGTLTIRSARHCDPNYPRRTRDLRSEED